MCCDGWKVCSEVLVFISELLALFEEFVLYLSSVTVCAVSFVWCCSCFHVSLLLGRNSFARILSSVYVFYVLEYFCMYDSLKNICKCDSFSNVGLKMSVRMHYFSSCK